MGDIRIENYKKSVQKITEKWGKEIAKFSVDLGKVDQELAELEKNKTPSDDEKAKIEDLRKQQAALRKKIDNCVLNLQVNLRVIEPEPGAPKKELLELPGWVKEIIKEKGIPLGHGVSIAPDIKIDVKALKLEKLGITITIEW
jgi:septation ring formation regulator EzrA